MFDVIFSFPANTDTGSSGKGSCVGRLSLSSFRIALFAELGWAARGCGIKDGRPGGRGRVRNRFQRRIVAIDHDDF